MSQKPIVIVTRKLPPAVEAALREHFDARLNDSDAPFDAHRLHSSFRDADAVLPTISDRIDATVLEGDVRARILANFGVGTDHIDLGAARRLGIAVSNTPGVLTDCTADLTIALMLAVMRRLGEAQRELHTGAWTGWRPVHMLGARVTGRTLGVIGFGRIGQAVARRAHHGFGMRVLFHTPHPPSADRCADLGAQPCNDLDSLLERSDVVSIHAPATPATRHLIDRSRIERMQPHAFLINTARGDLVDECALIDALRSRRLAGAGLDVFENEPHVSSELLALPTVFALPHIGSATLETRTAMGMKAVANLCAFFAGEPLPDRVA
jgi:lactate dehydrogenase-like 2-hydroxyacid dehydrogenase